MAISVDHRLYNGVAGNFSYATRKHGVGMGAGIWKFQQKRFFLFRVVKNKFYHSWSPLEKRLEKSNSAVLKNSLRRPCTW